MRSLAYSHAWLQVFCLGLLTLALAGDTLVCAETGCPTAPRRSATVRAFRRTHPCPATGTLTTTCPGYVIDHVLPLCAGGADSVENMMFQPVAAAATKDVWEKRLCARLRKCGCP
jgi:hypothetical protein